MNRIVEKRNESKIIVNGIETDGLIDTGSDISTLGEQFWNSLHSKPEIHVVEELEIKCIDGNTLPNRGAVELTIGVQALKGDSISALFLVVPMTDYKKTVPCIVGTNVIREFQKSNSDDTPEAWKVEFYAIVAQHVASVKTTSKVSLKPFEVKDIAGFVRKNRNCDAAITESTEIATLRICLQVREL